MNSLRSKLDTVLISFFQRYGLRALQLSLGIVFFWFGFLKFFPHTSPAEDLAINTIRVLTVGHLPDTVALKLLASWETIIGLGFLLNKFQRTTLFLLWTQMIGAWLPLIVFPDQMFLSIPFVLTLEGQYIVKNLVLIAATFVIGACVRVKPTNLPS
jgi:uncharacterized membrane protein YkgB